MLGWRILSSVLPIRMSLLERNVIHSLEEAACIFCCDDFEDLHHLLLGCVLARSVWEKVECWLQVDPIIETTVEEHFDSFAHLFSGHKSKKSVLIFRLATCWSIWLARNNSIFKGEALVLDSIIFHIKSTPWSWFIYGAGSNSGYVYDSWWNNAFYCINHLGG